MNVCFSGARLSAVSLACLSAFSAAVAAQGDASVVMLPESVVTATRFPETARFIPAAVSVITQEDIQKAGVTTVNEAIATLLGVVSRADYYGSGDTSLDLRGFGETANSNQVVVVDGIRISENDMSSVRLAGIPIDSVQSIEVLRGSSAVLYGEGGTAGVIVINTKAGKGQERKNSATVYGALGSFNTRDFRANATVSAGAFSLDAGVQERESDNYRDHAHSRNNGENFTAQWNGEAVRLGVRYGHDTLDALLPNSLTAAQFAANPRQSFSTTAFAEMRNETRGLFAEAVLGDWLLALDAGWRDRALDVDTGWGLSHYRIQSENVSVRAKHERQWSGLNNALMLGWDQQNWSRLAASTWSSNTAEQDSHGLYLKDDVTWASGLRLSVGARTEKIEKGFTDASATPLDERMSAWELGLSQPLNAATVLWGRMGKSYRLANADEYSFTDPSKLLQPQTSRDYEAGVRWALGGVKTEVRAYLNKLSNEIGYDPAANGPYGIGTGANVNFDPTRRQGLEWDGAWQLNAQWTVGGNAQLRNAKFREGMYAGKNMPLVAQEVVALRTQWAFSPNQRLTAYANWAASAYTDKDNTCRMPSYWTADVRYGYAWQNLEFALGVKNLLDKNYYTQAYGCAAGAPTGMYPETGRSFTVSVRAKF